MDQEEGKPAKELVVPVEIEAAPEGVISTDHLDQLDEDLQEYYPSEEECDEVVQEEEDDDHKPDKVMLHGDCDPPSMTYLTFAVALPNNQAGYSTPGIAGYSVVPSTPRTTCVSIPRG